jgi:hypothetical protein
VISQAQRLIAAALAHDTRGVNAKLAALATAEYFGTDDTPPDVTVVAAVDDAFAAVLDAPDTLPSLSVLFHQATGLSPFDSAAQQDGVFTFIVRYDATEDDPIALHRNCAHTMRAVMLSLAAWFRGAGAGEGKVLEGIQVIGPGQVRIGDPPMVSQEAAPITFSLYLELELQDIAT